MRKLLLFCLAAMLAAGSATEAGARKKQARQTRPEPQQGGLTPATPRMPFAFTRSKGWIEGRVALDSGAAKLVALFVPDLTEPGGTRSESSYLDADGRFRFAVELFCPTTMNLKYDGGWTTLYLYPDDTLRLEFRSADFRDGNDGSYGSLDFNANRSGEMSRHLAGFKRLQRATPVPQFAAPTDLESWLALLRSRDSADRATLARYAAAEHPSPEAVDMLGRTIRNLYAGYTWQGYMTGDGPVKREQVRELHRRAFPMTDDGDFADLPGHCYALYQTALSYMFSDTSSARSEREKLVNALDSIVTEYPASLSRDVMCLHIYCGVAAGHKTPELYSKIYPLRGRYIASPLVRDLVPEPPAGTPAAPDAATEAGEQNFYNLPLKEAERFIGRIFEPYRGSGKVLYVDVWGVGCAPCRAEMPNSVKLHGELAGQSVEFLYLCVDSKEKEWERLKKELKIEGTGRHILLSADEGNILRSYMGFTGVPTYWIIDKEGRLRGDSRPGDAATKALLLKLAGE